MATGRRHSDELLATSLACGGSIASAAAHAGVSERTASRRIADPDFQRILRAKKREIAQRPINAVISVMMEAVLKLRELLSAESQAVQLGAARSLVEYGLRAREQQELAERVEELEQALAGQANQRQGGTGARAEGGDA